MGEILISYFYIVLHLRALYSYPCHRNCKLHPHPHPTTLFTFLTLGTVLAAVPLASSISFIYWPVSPSGDKPHHHHHLHHQHLHPFYYPIIPSHPPAALWQMSTVQSLQSEPRSATLDQPKGAAP